MSDLAAVFVAHVFAWVLAAVGICFYNAPLQTTAWIIAGIVIAIGLYCLKSNRTPPA